MHLYLGYMEVMSAVKEENMKLWLSIALFSLYVFLAILATIF